MVWLSYNDDAPSLAMGSLVWVEGLDSLVPLQVQMVLDPGYWYLRWSYWYVLQCQRHTSCSPTYLSAVTQLRVFLS